MQFSGWISSLVLDSGRETPLVLPKFMNIKLNWVNERKGFQLLSCFGTRKHLHLSYVVFLLQFSNEVLNSAISNLSTTLKGGEFLAQNESILLWMLADRCWTTNDLKSWIIIEKSSNCTHFCIDGCWPYGLRRSSLRSALLWCVVANLKVHVRQHMGSVEGWGWHRCWAVVTWWHLWQSLKNTWPHISTCLRFEQFSSNEILTPFELNGKFSMVEIRCH